MSFISSLQRKTPKKRKKFEILDHLSDLKVKVFGKTRKELFKNAMVAMFEGADYQKDSKSQAEKCKIEISSFDFSSLLVDFLSEILYLSETKKLVFEKIKFQKFSEKEISAILFGKRLKRMGVHVKGVTYHGLKIKKNKIFKAEILFDI